jgi:putative membrane protein
MLLVFRTNSAYDRWWEGRKAWGSFVNNSRNLALKLSVLPLSDEEKTVFTDLISNYIFAAKEHLRGNLVSDHLLYNNLYTKEWYEGALHLPNRTMKALYIEIDKLYKSAKLTGDELLNISHELRSFTDNIGICERIKRTPIPFSYSLFFKKIIFIYVFTMPIGFVREFGYWAMPIVSLVFYVFGSIELLAEEIEDPFGLDPNDLPTDQIYETIKANLEEIMF